MRRSVAQSAQLAAVASRDRAKAQHVAQAQGVPRAYGTYEELVADPAIDALYIPLPNHLHFEWCVRALEADNHVLCEKPLTLSTAEVNAPCKVRDRTGQHIEEAFVYRNHPQWHKISELLRDEVIGQVHAVQETMALCSAMTRPTSATTRRKAAAPCTTWAPTSPVNQYTLQIERLSRWVRGEKVKSWPIEDAWRTMQTIERYSSPPAAGNGRH